MKCLADYLGTSLETQFSEPATPADSRFTLTGPEFSKAVLSSPEFRAYVVNNLVLGTLPAQIITKLMDYGWGAPPTKVHVTVTDISTMTKAELLDEIAALRGLAELIPDEAVPELPSDPAAAKSVH